MATITSRGERQWRVQVRRKGHDPVYRTFDAYADAKKWADELEGRISGETYVDRSEAKGTKLRELLTQYLDEVTPTKKGANQEEYRIAQWLREDMADWSIMAVQPKDIAEWRRKQESAGKAPSTVNNAINLLSSVYRIAISEWGYPISNPCQGVRRVKASAAREAHLAEKEEALLLDACERPIWLRPLVTLAIETGMRQGEILDLQWSAIAEDHAFLPTTKNGEPRRVPLSQRARETLTAWKGGQSTKKGDDVFPIHRQTLNEAYKAAVKAATEKGMPRVTFHDLRHVAATRLAQRLTPLELARVLGHKTMNMVLRYYNPKAGDLAAKIDGRNNGAGLLEEFQSVVQKMLAEGIDPRPILAALVKRKGTGKKVSD
jgi:integrase